MAAAVCMALPGCGGSSSQAQTAVQTEPSTAAQTTAKAAKTIENTATEETPAESSTETSENESSGSVESGFFEGMDYVEAAAEAVEKAGGGSVVSAERQTAEGGAVEWVIGVHKDGESEIEYVHVRENADSAIHTPIRQ